MSPFELRDQAVAEIVENFQIAASAFDPLLGLANARRGLHQLHNAAVGGQCASLEPAQRDDLISAYLAMLKNLGPTLEASRPYPAFEAWKRGPVGVILFWFDCSTFDVQLIGDTISLGASFLHLVTDVELLQSIVERSRQAPGAFAFIERAMAEQAGAVPASN